MYTQKTLIREHHSQRTLTVEQLPGFLISRPEGFDFLGTLNRLLEYVGILSDKPKGTLAEMLAVQPVCLRSNSEKLMFNL